MRLVSAPQVDREGFVENLADKFGTPNRRVKGDMTRFKEFIEFRGGTGTTH